ncbi:MAG: PKD domain-containing protein [Gammaproteobacteria bacterium]|nr:PKD domain-containing protein [Gammaproteobacteria bacterium]
MSFFKVRSARIKPIVAALGFSIAFAPSHLFAKGTIETPIAKQELQQYDSIVDLYAKDQQEYAKLAVTFHNELLEADRKQLKLTVNLNAEKIAATEKKGIKLQSNNTWLNQRKQRLDKLPTIVGNEKSIPGFECYETVEETYEVAEQLVNDYPTLAEWVDIGDSWQKSAGQNGYDLMVLKITNQAVENENKPILFIHSAMHAREYATAPLSLAFARELLSNYSTDADTNWIVDHQEIHFLFHMNPDGRKQAEQGVLWRKNNNTSHCPSQSPGVDLNRNFSFFWNQTNGIGSSGNECDSTYRGPEAASEPETQAVINYINSIYPDSRGENDADAAPLDTPGMHLDIHSFSELVLWPWGNTDELAPNATELQTLGRKLAWFNGYYPTQSVGLYPTDGTSDEASYAELGIANFTFELGTAFFQSCAEFESTVKPDNLAALYYSAKVTRAPYMLPAGPDVLNVSGNNSETPQVVPGDVLTLTLLANDGRYSSANGSEPTQPIADVKVFIDQTPWEAGAIGMSMNFADGNANSASENMTLNLSTNDWTEGRKQLFFQATDSEGNMGPVSAMWVDVGSNQSPMANFNFNCDEFACSFDASTSTDDNQITAYQWDFGDGTGSTGVTTNHTFAQSGSYIVTLTVTDAQEAQSEAERTVTLTAPTNPDEGNGGSGGGSLWVTSLLLLLLQRSRAGNRHSLKKLN